MSKDSKTKEHLLLLFDRPKEPIFMPKGDAAKAVFDAPKEYLNERFRNVSENALTDRFAEDTNEHIRLKPLASLPDLSVPSALDREDNFSLFIPWHREMAGKLIEILISQPSLDELLSAAAYAREQVNPLLFNYALSVTIYHRDDTKNMNLPTLVELFPQSFMDTSAVNRGREVASAVPDGFRDPVVIPRDYTASDLDPEHRLAYFREDLGINLHHWHWHLVYPFVGPPDIVNKDRRGELFYFMHHQIMCRYNFERLSHNLGLTKRVNNLREPIAEGYFPKIDTMVSTRNWPARSANSVLSDVTRRADQLVFDIQDMERWMDKIYDAINNGRVVLPDGTTRDIDNVNGIDVLGNMIEASILNPNRALYGDIHNMAHVAIGVAHDPDHRHLETFGVLGDPATAMRDPAFYRIHAWMDNIFQLHKDRLPAYSTVELGFDGVRVKSLKTVLSGVSAGKGNNILFTQWQESNVDMSRGLDFSPRGAVRARFTHLQHVAFSYEIEVVNSNQKDSYGTVRIFLAPKYDERGSSLLYADQKNMFIEMDKFPIKLKAGTHTIKRESKESSVIIPFEQTFRNLETAEVDLSEFNFCGCGWPEHMLVPMGSPAGFWAQLFVMISDMKGDLVAGAQPPNRSNTYCGLRDKKYPDKRSMGFPFDRRGRSGVNKLEQFMTPNMAVIDVLIKHNNIVKAGNGASH